MLFSNLTKFYYSIVLRFMWPWPNFQWSSLRLESSTVALTVDRSCLLYTFTDQGNTFLKSMPARALSFGEFVLLSDLSLSQSLIFYHTLCYTPGNLPCSGNFGTRPPQSMISLRCRTTFCNVAFTAGSSLVCFTIGSAEFWSYLQCQKENYNANFEELKQGRIYGNPVADGWAGAVMTARNSKMSPTDQQTRQGVE